LSRRAYISHAKCLNCGAELKGRYCYACGQDSEEHISSVRHLAQHFFEDITHYDGKLWKTVRPLLTKPGFLTQEFLKGKRISYLNPVRMFIFLNFIFFFLLLSTHSADSRREVRPINVVQLSQTALAKDSAGIKINGLTIKQKEALEQHQFFSINETDLMTRSRYDSTQASLPPAARDNVFKRMWKEKLFDALNTVNKDPDHVMERIGELFLHNAAKLTFLFLIVCSLLLSLVYYRRHILLIDHALLSIHLSCTFLLLLVFMLLASYLPMAYYIMVAIFLYGLYYFYRSLRNVYKQPHAKTFLKFMLINLFLATAMLIGIIVNALCALMSV
jgi:hypothetical protein